MKIEQSFRVAYQNADDIYSELQLKVRDFLMATCSTNQWHFTDRKKEEESYTLKVLTGRSEGYEIDDFYACTIVVPNLLAIDSAKKLVSKCFDVDEEKPGEEIRTRPTEFSFDGLRLYCSLKKGIKETPVQSLCFEIQIKTFLEHAWALATHDFSYKGKSVSWAKERLSAQIKAVLDNADLSIFEMERLSQSEFLNKKNKKYEETNQILDFLNNKFGRPETSALPEDIKRLAKEIYRLISRINLSLDDIKTYLDEETNAGRGYKTRNLSIYSIILVSIRHQNSNLLINGLKKNARRTDPYIVIPEEACLDELLAGKKMKRVKFLKDCNNSFS